MTEQQNERRRDVRVTFRTTVKLVFSDGRSFDGCETMDVSVSGIFVKGVIGVGFGEKCHVELLLSGRTSSLLLKLAGEIVRSQEEGVAVHFSEVDEDSFYHLQNIVYFSYKHSGGVEDILADVEDDTLYYDLDSSRKAAPLPDDYLEDINGNDSDDFDDDSSDNIDEHIKHRYEDEDY